MARAVTLGHLSAQLAVGQGSLWAALHELARRLATVPQHLLLAYRRALVKHADETGWPNDGHNGYAWLFCTERISLFRFREKAARLYHWAKNPAIPADNHRAERELRPLVSARKISFGSQSEQDAQTCEILMSVLHTLPERTNDVLGAFKRVPHPRGTG